MEMQLSGGKNVISANSAVLIHLSVKMGIANVPRCQRGFIGHGGGEEKGGEWLLKPFF